MADDEKRRIEKIPTRERGEATWHTSALAAYLVRTGLHQSRVADFSPRNSLVGLRDVKAPSPATAEDPWPFRLER
jgi:hypothetical protein